MDNKTLKDLMKEEVYGLLIAGTRSLLYIPEGIIEETRKLDYESRFSINTIHTTKKEVWIGIDDVNVDYNLIELINGSKKNITEIVTVARVSRDGLTQKTERTSSIEDIIDTEKGLLIVGDWQTINLNEKQIVPFKELENIGWNGIIGIPSVAIDDGIYVQLSIPSGTVIGKLKESNNEYTIEIVKEQVPKDLFVTYTNRPRLRSIKHGEFVTTAYIIDEKNYIAIERLGKKGETIFLKGSETVNQRYALELLNIDPITIITGGKELELMIIDRYEGKLKKRETIFPSESLAGLVNTIKDISLVKSKEVHEWLMKKSHSITISSLTE